MYGHGGRPSRKQRPNQSAKAKPSTFRLHLRTGRKSNDPKRKMIWNLEYCTCFNLEQDMFCLAKHRNSAQSHPCYRCFLSHKIPAAAAIVPFLAQLRPAGRLLLHHVSAHYHLRYSVSLSYVAGTWSGSKNPRSQLPRSQWLHARWRLESSRHPP